MIHKITTFWATLCSPKNKHRKPASLKIAFFKYLKKCYTQFLCLLYPLLKKKRKKANVLA